MFQRLLAAAALVLLGAAPTFDSSVDAPVKSHLTPSVSVAIVEHGKLAYTRTSGAATASTVYAVGSVTKMFTAVSVFQLIDGGKLSLDDRLSKFYPAYPHGSEITIRQLLGHRSGIHNYGDEAIIAGQEYTPVTPAQLIASFEKKPLDFTPGTKWAYSNSGYVLLGQIVERISHQPLAEYESAHVFAPAGMKQTAMGRAARGMTLATPYQLVGPMPLRLAPANLSWYYACGDIVSSAADLARFDIALLGGKLVKPASLAQMQSVLSKDTLAKGYDDGLGLFSHVISGKTMIGHHGGEPGYAADNEMIPSDGFAAIVLMNTLANTDKVLTPLMSSVYPDAPKAATDTVEDFSATDSELRLLSFIEAVRQSKLDRSILAKAMDAAMTPALTKQLGGLFQQWGPVKQLTFVNAVPQDKLMTYVFTMTCADGTHNVNFTLDADKKVAGIFFPAG